MRQNWQLFLFFHISSDLEAQINDIRIRKAMPGGVFDHEEVFSKFGSSEGHADDDGSETDSEEDESSADPNREHQKFKGKYHRLRKYIKELMFVSKVLSCLRMIKMPPIC